MQTKWLEFEPLFILLRKWYNKVNRSTNRGVNSAGKIFFYWWNIWNWSIYNKYNRHSFSCFNRTSCLFSHFKFEKATNEWWCNYYLCWIAEQVNIAENIDLPISYEVNEIKLKEATFIIVGIFGIGLSREIEGHYRTIIEQINQQKQASIIALDIPSGLSAKSGEVFKTVVQADFTYTFGFLKKGMDTRKGKKTCGKITICDIGYPKKQFQNR